MWKFETAFSEVINRAPGVKSFRFPISPAKAAFRSGQFMFVDIKVNGEEALHHFTISSSPRDLEYLEFTKRITEHEYSKALDAVKPGDWAVVQGPSGGFTLPAKPKKIAFLTGGIGITPVRSMLRYIYQQKQDWDIVLLNGNKDFENIVFRDELEQIKAAIPSLRIEHFLAEPPGDWKGRIGTIDKDAIIETVNDYNERTFFISGPPRMVMSLQDQLSALKIPQDQIMRDSFTGYD